MILKLLQQDGHQIKRKGNDEFSSSCPACGGTDRFIIKATDQATRFFCRQCEIKGDAIEYLRTFRKICFKEALEHIGKHITPQLKGHNTKISRNTPRSAIITAPPIRCTKSGELIVWAAKALLDDNTKLEWLLKKRGITRETAERFRLGWIESNIYDSRVAWGLPEEIKPDGTPRKMLIPAGLLIPGPDRIRIRRSAQGEYGKYHVVNGSGNAPLIINSNLPRDDTPAIIVESELDAILLCQELHEDLLIIATGSTANGPSAQIIDDLRQRPFVLVSLDSDNAGAKASWAKWINVLPNGQRAPVPMSWGKDHTEAHLDGHDLNQWLSATYTLANSAISDKKGKSSLPQMESISCFSCGHYDGKGAAWPGMCRYFETIGQTAKEIDFNVVDPIHGCGCYKSLQIELISLATSDDPEWIQRSARTAILL